MTTIQPHSGPVGGPPAISDADAEFLTFRLGDVEYGMDILKVQEIRGYEAPIAVASAPPCVKGVLNLRGVIVPIIDLRLRLNLPHAPYNNITVTMVLVLQDRVVGVVVDSVTDVVKLGEAQIKPVPRFESPANVTYVNGIGTVRSGAGDRLLLLLDIDRFLARSDGIASHTTH